MIKRVLIAVESCQQYRFGPVHDAIRETWFKNICTTDKRFFYGAGNGFHLICDDSDTTNLLESPDDYKSLPYKTREICRWALKHDFDFLFKVDTDTVVNPWTWVDTKFWEHDYMGGENADTNVPGFAPSRIEFASGGAGYTLNKKSLTIVANAPIMDGMQAEDVFVADALLKHGIKPMFHPGYRWRPGAVVDKDIITLHLSSALQKKYEPSQMYEVYRQIEGTL